MIAWDRKQMMRDVVALVASTATKLGYDAAEVLRGLDPVHVANTYGGDILPCEVEAEKLKHMQEGEGK